MDDGRGAPGEGGAAYRVRALPGARQEVPGLLCQPPHGVPPRQEGGQTFRCE